MPDNLVRLGKYKHIFLYDNIPSNTLPSLRPHVHLLVDTKVSVHEYDSISLSSWSLKANERLCQDYRTQYNFINDFQFVAHVICKQKPSDKVFVDLQFYISIFNLIFACLIQKNQQIYLLTLNLLCDVLLLLYFKQQTTRRYCLTLYVVLRRKRRNLVLELKYNWLQQSFECYWESLRSQLLCLYKTKY